VVAAYLLHSRQATSGVNALEIIRTAGRSQCDPNLGFLAQLRAFEKTVPGTTLNLAVAATAAAAAAAAELWISTLNYLLLAVAVATAAAAVVYS
jgi:hypothetical protein